MEQLLIIVILTLLLFLFGRLISVGFKGNHRSFKGFLINAWHYGTNRPIQRVGIIFLLIGALSFVAWCIEDNVDIDYFFQDYSLPAKRDHWFYHLHIYFILIGLLLSWGHFLLLSIYTWLLTGENPFKSKKS